MMIGKIGNILAGTQNAIIQSIQGTQRLVDRVQLALATGRDVNSALDNPQSFFLSRTLSYTAQDMAKVLDGIATSIKRIQETNIGIEAIVKLLDQADALLAESRVNPTTSTLLTDEDIAAILAANPGLQYYTGSGSFYRVVTTAVTAAAAYTAAESSTLIQPEGLIGIEGVNGYLANITSAAENSFIEGLINANSWIGGSDLAVEGQWRWAGGPETGLQFWQGNAAGNAVNGAYTNWNAGEPNQSGNEDYMEIRNGTGVWNDESGASNRGYVIEWHSSIFVQNHQAIDPEYKEQFLQIMQQIDEIAEDAHYRGVKLLMADNLKTYFSTDESKFLLTEGINATSNGLGLVGGRLELVEDVDLELKRVRSAREKLRLYAQTMKVDLGSLTIRVDFTRSSINTHKNAALDLVLADPNEKGAELLALQTRQLMQFEALSIASESSLGDLF